MQPRNLLILTLVVLVLGGFIVFYERDLPSTDERVLQAKKVLALEADEVRAVEIAWEGHTVRLERQAAPAPAAADDADAAEDEAEAESPPAEWRIIQPLAARADRAAVASLVAVLTGLEKDRTLEGIDRAAAGLAPPRVRVTLETEDGATVLEVGDEVPASTKRIVAIAGQDAAYQVRDALYDELTKAPGDWRDKRVFAGERGAIERLTLAAGSSPLVLARKDEEFWLESPLADRADEELVNALLTGLVDLQVLNFLDVPPPLAEMGLQPSVATVEAVLAGQEQPFRVELGASAAGGGVYARSGDLFFTTETTLGETVARAPQAWRARAWSGSQPFAIDTAKAEDGSGTLTITRDEADWKRGEDRIAYATVSDFLYAVTDVKAQEVLERAEAEARGLPLATPQLEVVFETGEGSEELQLYRAAGGVAAATASGRPAVLVLAEADAQGIVEKLAAVRNAEPLADEPAETDADAPATDASE